MTDLPRILELNVQCPVCRRANSSQINITVLVSVQQESAVAGQLRVPGPVAMRGVDVQRIVTQITQALAQASSHDSSSSTAVRTGTSSGQQDSDDEDPYELFALSPLSTCEHTLEDEAKEPPQTQSHDSSSSTAVRTGTSSGQQDSDDEDPYELFALSPMSTCEQTLEDEANEPPQTQLVPSVPSNTSLHKEAPMSAGEPSLSAFGPSWSRSSHSQHAQTSNSQSSETAGKYLLLHFGIMHVEG